MSQGTKTTTSALESSVDPLPAQRAMWVMKFSIPLALCQAVWIRSRWPREMRLPVGTLLICQDPTRSGGACENFMTQWTSPLGKADISPHCLVASLVLLSIDEV